MVNEKYEIEPVFFGEDMHHETIVGLLTGLELREIQAVAPNNHIWYTKTYLEVFHKLGFSTNQKFKKFDPETIYPCIMRCQAKPPTSYWYSWVYYDHRVYESNGSAFTFERWIKRYSNDYRVTSMLQVWI